MDKEHKYRVNAWWSSGKSGIAKSELAPNAIQFTAPPEFGGLDGRWTPEDLLLCALASCYTTTFRALADYSKLEYADLSVEVEGTVMKTESGYAFREIVIRPTLSISSEQERCRCRKQRPCAWYRGRFLWRRSLTRNYISLNRGLSLIGRCQLPNARSVPWEVQG